jgi:hypothetical protein
VTLRRIAGKPLAASIAAALALAGGCGSTARSTATTTVATAGIPPALLSEARPVGVGPRFQPPVSGPVIGRCRRTLGPRIGVHVEVFAENRVVIVPAGIGTLPPRTYSAGRISGARCYGELVTLEPTGVVLLRPGATLTVATLLRSWGQPLASSRVASFSAPRGTQVETFVAGRRWRGPPGDVPLARHAEIVLEVGPYVPPHHSYTFPPGT